MVSLLLSLSCPFLVLRCFVVSVRCIFLPSFPCLFLLLSQLSSPVAIPYIETYYILHMNVLLEPLNSLVSGVASIREP